jgi:hypothetical protein
VAALMPELAAESPSAARDEVPVHRLSLDAAERLSPWWPSLTQRGTTRRA